MRDLSIRGAGNILGAQQHGFIDSVGFDLYSQMLKEAIEERKGDPAAVNKRVWKLTLKWMRIFQMHTFQTVAKKLICISDLEVSLQWRM